MPERKHLVRIVVILICILVVWVLYISSKQLERNHKIEQEVSSLQSEAERIRRENEDLSQKINYFSSTDFREQEAKEKLGLKKIDESVVVIKPRPQSEGEEALLSNERVARKETVMIPNYQKWWQIFFQKI